MADDRKSFNATTVQEHIRRASERKPKEATGVHATKNKEKQEPKERKEHTDGKERIIGKKECPPRKSTGKETKEQRIIKKFRNIDFSRKDSDHKLTVQTLEFPDVNIKRTDLHKRDECGQSVVQKRGRDLGSSSNSHFRNGVMSVKIRKKSCTSSTSAASSSRISSERPSGRVRGMPDSQEMIDSLHEPSERLPYFKGEAWKKPCPASFIAGAPRSHIGRCPDNYNQLAKLRPSRQKFFLTQDPRVTHCLVNPVALRHKPLTKVQEYEVISKMVKHGDNLCASTGSEGSESHISELIDLQNPLNLDFHGMDYKNTYEQDENEQEDTQTYWRVNRYMARRATKKNTQVKVEAELKAERLAVPKRFTTQIKDEPIKEEPPVKSPRLVDLYRSPDKPANKKKIDEERAKREERYKDIYLREKQRELEEEKAREKKEAAEKEIQARTVAEQDLSKDLAIIDDAIERSFRKNVEIKPVVRNRKVFPKTLTETERLKAVMHRENCVSRDLAKVTQQFFLERTGKMKKLHAAEQNLRCEESIEGSVGSTPSEQSSDDEDYLKVGKIGDHFQLRGFHFKHGDGLRGKLHRHQIMQGQRTVKGCLTREEWLNQLVPHKEPIKLDIERGIIKVMDPDDPNLDLFPPAPLLMRQHVRQSAVREFIDKRLGMHYHRLLRKNIKVIKPKLQYNVRKFNLIRYVFPEKVIVPDDRDLVDVVDVDVLDATKTTTTLEYLKLKQKIASIKRHKKKLARMELLGLPCQEIKRQQLRDLGQDEGDHEDIEVDWVPTPEPPYDQSATDGQGTSNDSRLSAGCETPRKDPSCFIPTWKRYGMAPNSQKNRNRNRYWSNSILKGRMSPENSSEDPESRQKNTYHDRYWRNSIIRRQQAPADHQSIASIFRNSRNREGYWRKSKLCGEKTSNGRLMAGETYQPMRYRGNMPAPKLREKTLTIHPRRRRDYETERIPSALFNEVLPYSPVPLMEQPEEERKRLANVRKKKRRYTDLFEARHHHDHWAPTELRNVHVQYQNKTVYPEITTIRKRIKEPVFRFEKANPPCKKHIDMDMTMPRYDFEAMIREHLAVTRTDNKEATGEVVHDLCYPHDFVFHSRDPEEIAKLDFPGRRQYLEFLRETREAIYETKDIEPGEERLLVDRKAIEADLEEDLQSIQNCLSSLSSSTCTDLSNDSGSFLVVEGKTKIPLDYIRKPLVPFEEMRRSRFHATVIDVNAEDEDPYRMLPFSGQHKEQSAIMGPKDTFFTFSTRLRNSLRLRLEVEVPDVRNTLLGPGHNKYYGAVITDLDENYIEELKSRANVKTFNFKTGIELLKDAMRLKYESLLIQGQMVRTKIYDRMNERHWVNMKNTKNLYEGLFAKWQKKQYNAAMMLVYQVKAYYEITDKLKQEYRELERELMMLNMDIVFIEGHWIRCIMLQNFHYLMGDQDWRMENDWIHLVPAARLGKEDTEDVGEEQELDVEEEEEVEMELERADISIAKRAIVNIRVRDKDDAWAIRAFYYDVYMQKIHPILQVFPDAEAFLQGVNNLKTQTFMTLLEMHFTLSIHTELQGRLETFMDWCSKHLKEKEEYVARKSAKKFFMEGRAIEMEARVLHYLGKPIEQSFADEEYNKHRAVIAEVWRRIIPETVRGTSDVLPSSADMVAGISDVVMELLGKFEHLDIHKARQVEQSLRKKRRYLQKISAQAYQVERRIEMEMKKVRRNLEPPYKPPKREGRLPRLFLKKRVVKQPVQKIVISENTKNFMRAFKDDGEVIGDSLTQDSLMVVDNMQEQIVPFYFDHFLKINGYTPNYNFKTNIELRDGPELARFKVKEVLPDVIIRLENWELMHKKIMEENIQRNPKMYENIS
ncbi:GL19072 [Drosophila persimilis]|uniref:GL19072 n=1 Tax=Drosophila persimilis TaxID=7234 RepID=B4G6H1_DROPE|nr:GL19072 [Drosophila persimilis]